MRKTSKATVVFGFCLSFGDLYGYLKWTEVQNEVRVFRSKANMGPLTSPKRSYLFSYGLRGKQLTFIASKRNTIAAPRFQ